MEEPNNYKDKKLSGMFEIEPSKCLDSEFKLFILKS